MSLDCQHRHVLVGYYAGLLDIDVACDVEGLAAIELDNLGL